MFVVMHGYIASNTLVIKHTYMASVTLKWMCPPGSHKNYQYSYKLKNYFPESGYNLVVLQYVVTVLNVTSYFIQRKLLILLDVHFISNVWESG